MRAYILVMTLIVLLASCSEKPKVNISNSFWYMTITNDTSGSLSAVYLKISGTTNADKVTVESYGDGLLTEQNIALDSTKSFKNATVQICFEYRPSLGRNKMLKTEELKVGTPNISTKVKAYKGSDTSLIILKSAAK